MLLLNPFGVSVSGLWAKLMDAERCAKKLALRLSRGLKVKVKFLAIAFFSVVGLRQASAQCTKDTDCKGDRICLKGSCVDPQIVTMKLLCSYVGGFGEQSEVSTEFRSEHEASQIIGRITKGMSLAPNFVVRSASVGNAAAAIQGSDRFVLYNPNFVSQVVQQTGTDWAPISILAHEIGHHLNGDTLDQRGSRPPIELNADEFSGSVMFQLGATLEQALIAMKTISPEQGSVTHPGRAERLDAIKRGWDRAKEAAQRNREIKQETTTSRDTSNICEYARDGVCDEGIRCKPGTDQDDCRPSTTDRQAQRPGGSQGLPPGALIGQCGCWGPVMPGLRADLRCQSGVSYPQACPGWCVGGGNPWLVACQ